MKAQRFAFITRAIKAEPSTGECIVRTVLAVAIPTGMRWLIDGGASGAPFVLYFPAIQMIATYLGWRWGALTALGSGLAGWGIFLPPTLGFALHWPQLIALGLFSISAATMVLVGHVFRGAVLELGARARQSDDFNQELQHRTKNSLQMMRALASQASKATDPGEFYEMLGGRLGALAKANELLRFGALKSCDIGDLVGAAIAPFEAARFAIRGPDLSVSRNACTPLMMALHELATNASKYGALSVPGGTVRIGWRAAGEPGLFHLSWEEVGGPVVAEPTRKGMGSRLLRATGGIPEVTHRFLPGGVVCDMTVAGGVED